ncbi:MAG: cation:proton antiporter [Thermoleophilia bacterium]|nr:cation:proton antiporter [Thermoleophilia bacterium]
MFVVLLAAKVGDELFKRLGQPTLIGEILAGVIVGPAVLGFVEPGEVIDVFAELGVVFILFWVGLETRIHELLGVGRSAALVGVLGVIVPFAGGYAFAAARGEDTATSLFFAAALVATSVGITSAVLIGIGALETRSGRTILGAAVVDDILAMLVVAVASAIAVGGGASVVELLVVAGMAFAFVGFFALGGTRLMRRYPRVLEAPRFSESPLLPAVILCLGLAAVAAEIGLAAIIGAFLAGMMVAETKEQHPIEEEVAPLYAFFAPFFFASIGLQLDLGEYARPTVVGVIALVTAIAVATKLLGAYIGARGLSRSEALFVAVGMVPRGEVGIIVAGIGIDAGALQQEAFAIIVGMAVLTTVIVPPVLRTLARRLPDTRTADATAYS